MTTLVALLRSTAAGLRVLLALTVLLGVGYPLAVTALAHTAFSWQAQGSLVTAEGTRTTDVDDAVGSALIGQAFTGDASFHSRPSAAGEGYDPRASSGTNLGPNNPDLLADVQARVAEVADREGVATSLIPPDAVTSSASGLDPHISPDYAEIQVPRVARAAGLTEDQVRDLVAEHTDGRGAGVLGEPRVTVLTLNLAVRRLAGS